MNRISLLLTAMMAVTFMIVMTPSIMAMNYGKILQRIALWLAIFLGLAILYKNFGPDSPHPFFQAPNVMSAGSKPGSPIQSPAGDQSPAPAPEFHRRPL